MAHPLARRPVYTDEQMSKYLSWIDMGRLDAVKEAVQREPLEILTKLQRRNMAAVPFGSVALHYAQFHALSLDSDALYTKMVERHLGGYCMENNTFFGIVLRSLGYRLYSAGARISNVIDAGPDRAPRDPEGYMGWNHMVNLVIIAGQKYHVDVGFGAQGACAPSPLVEGHIVDNVPTSQTTLVYRHIAPYTDPDQKVWILEMRDTPGSPWKPGYCFTDHEFIEADFISMNYHSSTHRSSMFTYRLVLFKVVLEEDNYTLAGTMVLDGAEVKRRVHGKSEILEKFGTEEARVKGLKNWFDIELKPEEIRGIHGMVTELRPPQEAPS